MLLPLSPAKACPADGVRVVQATCYTPKALKLGARIVLDEQAGVLACGLIFVVVIAAVVDLRAAAAGCVMKVELTETKYISRHAPKWSEDGAYAANRRICA
jgi:hypothetical protein